MQPRIEWKSDRRLKLLRELVEINSGTQNQAGVAQVQAIVERELKALGFKTELLPHPETTSGPFLVGTLMQDPDSTTFVDLLTHADTVFEKDSGFLEFKLFEDKGIATGPGVIDDKGGIVVALTGVQRHLQQKGQKKLNLRFLCTPSEETGSHGFIQYLEKLGLTSALVLGFEPSLEDGSIVESRRGNRWFDIDVKGRDGHAGRDHATTVNAAHELAFKLTHLQGLTDYDREITVSTGQISGGSKFNIVCGHAHAKVDVRFGDFEGRRDTIEKIEKILETPYLAPNKVGEVPQTTYTIANDCPPFARSAVSEVYLQKYLFLIEQVEGIKVGSKKSGGAADANYMSRPDLVILDGLGAQGGGMHRTDEFINLGSLETRSEILAQFLSSL